MIAPARQPFMPVAPLREDARAWLEDAPRGEAAAWVEALRATGAEVFSQNGLPGPKTEGWQYTNLRPLSPPVFRMAAAPRAVDAAALPPPLPQCAARIVVANGRFQPSLSTLPEGAGVWDLMDAAENMPELPEHLVDAGGLAGHPFRALNAAHLREGFVLRVPGGVDIAAPVEVLFYNTGGGAAYPRVLYWLGENAGACIVERHAGAGAGLSCPVVDVVQEASSRLSLLRLMEEGADAFHFSHTLARMHRESSLNAFVLATGGRVARQEFRLEMLGPRVFTGISGVYMIKGVQNHDFTVSARHFAPDCKSTQFFKGVADDQARAVFQGTVHVHRSAQGTDGQQSHHALLLSPQAEACVKPELEIYADDVKCGHGTTSGQLDESALFYMRSRGIPEAQAKSLLIESFLNETLERIPGAELRAVCAARISAWLEGRGA